MFQFSWPIILLAVIIFGSCESAAERKLKKSIRASLAGDCTGYKEKKFCNCVVDKLMDKYPPKKLKKLIGTNKLINDNVDAINQCAEKIL